MKYEFIFSDLNREMIIAALENYRYPAAFEPDDKTELDDLIMMMQHAEPDVSNDCTL